MRNLAYERHPLDAGAVVITASLVRKKGDDVYLCDNFDQLQEAMDEGAPFLAHKVVGVNPVDLIVNPANVVTIERVKG